MTAANQSANSPSRRVLIIGGGLVGLTLATALEKRNVPCSVFERNAYSNSRGPGWGITLHWGLPIFASLVPARIYDRLDSAAVNPAAQHAGEWGKFAFYNLQTGVARFETPMAEKCRVRREGLKDILSDGIDVQFEKQLVNAYQRGDGGVTAVFADDSVAEGSLLVGCDGAHSAVRSLLVGKDSDRLPLHQLPLRLLGVTAVFKAAVVQPLRNLDPYFMQGGDPSRNVFLFFSFLDTPSNNNRADSDSYACQIIISWPFQEPKLLEIPKSASARLKLMKDISSDWAEPFSTIVAAIPEDSVPLPITLEDWSPRVDSEKVWSNDLGNITLAGDAAHSMTMYRGEAFNHGLRDIESLLHHIEPLLKEPHSEGDLNVKMRTAIDAYEAELCVRGASAVMASRQACLDAHDQSRINAQSPLVARRILD